jgi:hypothetical protein
VIDTNPSLAEIEAAFCDAGFPSARVEQVRQVSAPSLHEVATQLRRQAHTPLQLITDDEYARGVARIRAAAETETGPVIDSLDLLVLR